MPRFFAQSLIGCNHPSNAQSPGLESDRGTSPNSVAWGIFDQDGSGGSSTGLLAASIKPLIGSDSPRFPVRIQITGKPPIPLTIGQTVTVAIRPSGTWRSDWPLS